MRDRTNAASVTLRVAGLSFLLGAFALPAQAQPKPDERAQLIAVEAISQAMGPEPDQARLDGLFHPNAQLVVEGELAWTPTAFREILEARGCGPYIMHGTGSDVAAFFAQARSGEAEVAGSIDVPALVAGCTRDDGEAEYDVYVVDLEDGRVRRVRLAATFPAPPPPPVITVAPVGPPRPAIPPSETLSAELGPAVVGYLGGLFIGNLDRSESFLADEVEIAVSDGNRTVQTFPRGRVPARAMYLSMTNERALSLENFSCRPEAGHAICDLIIGRNDVSRHFTLRLFAADGQITRILSWENHGKPVR